MTHPLFDDETFFIEYKKLRERTDSFNILLEQPAFFAMLPSVAGKRVLDLGCGFGDACRQYVQLGASTVVGLDISQKMLAEARRLTDTPKVHYQSLDMDALVGLAGPFDLVTSSLAIHYVLDFPKLPREIWALLAEGGHFVFSQEHPLTTAPEAGPEYCRDEDGRPLHYKLTDYGREGGRSIQWFIDNVRKQHRTFSSIVNALVETGFRIEKLAEPMPTPEAVAINPELAKEFHKPSFLIIRASKPRS